MTQNFDPLKLASDVADLCTRVANLEKAIAGGKMPDFADLVSTVEDTAKIVGDFVPRVAAVEKMVEPLAPLIPVLAETFSGQSAGTGAATDATNIPAEQLGSYVKDAGKNG